jgi:Flp pilus assembly pilin Flp
VDGSQRRRPDAGLIPFFFQEDPMELLKRLLSDERGQDIPEYALLLALGVGALVLLGIALRDEIQATFQEAINLLQRARSGR